MLLDAIALVSFRDVQASVLQAKSVEMFYIYTTGRAFFQIKV